MALSKEEKKAKKEAKLKEKLRAELEIRKKLKWDELQREMAAQASKRGELDKMWRDLMIKIKEPLFRQDIEVMWHTFERVFDKKDHLIKHTMRLRETADDQFQRTFASFCETIDTMTNKFLSDLDSLSKQNDLRTAELLERGEADAIKITEDHKSAETHLQLLIYHGYTTADNAAWTTRGENLVKQDEERIKYTNYRENLRSFLENKYNALWEEYKAVLKAYIVETADSQKKIRKLRKKENLMADIIASQGKKIASSDGMLKHLRTELSAYESGTKQAVFRDRRNRHRAACGKLKKRLVNGCALDVNQLALLVRAANNAIEWLEAAAKKAQKISRMAALCRKFESQREKVLPYGTIRPHSPIEVKHTVREQKSDESLIVNALSSTSGLTRLWQRIAKAELTKMALIKEKQLLEQENAFIISKLQEYKNKNTKTQHTRPEAKQCNCYAEKKKGTSNPPVSVEGVLEVRKYN